MKEFIIASIGVLILLFTAPILIALWLRYLKFDIFEYYKEYIDWANNKFGGN